jgi:hypothetical protein
MIPAGQCSGQSGVEALNRFSRPSNAIALPVIGPASLESAFGYWLQHVMLLVLFCLHHVMMGGPVS